MTSNFTVRLDPELNQRLRKAAELTRRRPADFARIAIEDAVAGVEGRAQQFEREVAA